MIESQHCRTAVMLAGGSVDPGSPETREKPCCIWCGQMLRIAPQARRKAVENREVRLERGDYGDGFFCGLRCGYAFGVGVADQNRGAT